jgi:putative acetyltransferase
VGAALIRAGLEACGAHDWEAVFLVGDPRYYARFGFRLANASGFSCDGPHNPFLQFVELRQGACANFGSKVSFHPVFAEFEAE